MDNGSLTLGSLFDGIGGFPFAAAIAGIKPIWAAEVDPACVAVTKHRFPEMEHLGSVTEINGAEITPVDIIAFGSPCQGLSIAGKQAGLDDKRSGLFKEAIRIIYEMRSATNGKYPTFIVWENVPGAFSSHQGRDFRTVLEEITKTDIPMPASGKWAPAGVVRSERICAAWRQLDAQYWGVPQRRKRIYLIGSFGSSGAEEILFERDSVRRYLTPSGTARKGAPSDTAGGAVVGGECFDARGNGDGRIAPTMTGDHNSRVTDYSAVIVQAKGFPLGFRAENTKCYDEKATTLCNGTRPGFVNGLCIQGKSIGRADKNAVNGIGINENLSFTLNTVDQHGVVYAIGNGQANNTGLHEKAGALNCMHNQQAVVYAIDRAAFNQGENALYDVGISEAGINSTLVAKGPSAVAYQFIKWIVRRLTPLECERLQGYPDGWTLLPKIEKLTDEEYAFFLQVFLLDKKMRGKACKRPPSKASLVKWYNKLDCDGNRYRQLGNSLAIPCALRVIGGIADYIAKEQ